MTNVALLVLVVRLTCYQARAADYYINPNIMQHQHWSLLPEHECGNSVASDRIVGGANASMGQYPWIIQIGYKLIDCKSVTKPMFRCSGSVINEWYIVTAAHCTTHLPLYTCSYEGKKRFRLAILRLGENFADRQLDCDDEICAPPVQDILPAQILVHAKYDPKEFKNDIGLIRTKTKISFNGWVAPICLARGNQLLKDYIGTIAEVAGWGIYDLENPKSSDALQFVTVPIINLEHCQYVYHKVFKVGPEQVCAGGVEGKDSCGGDSGGPLMVVDAYDGPPKYYLMGLVSFGATKCGNMKPAVYTRISAYIEWILNNLRP